MVNQANNNTGDLVTFFLAQAQTYGRWMAMAESRARIKLNLIAAGEFKRAVVHEFQQDDWTKAHKWGKDFAHLFNEDSPELPELLNMRPRGVTSKVFSGLRAKVLAKRVKVSSRSDKTEPVWFQCGCCDVIKNYADSEETVGDRRVRICTMCISNGYVRESNCMGGYILGDYAAQCYHDAEAFEAREFDWATRQWCESEGYTRRNGYWFSDDALEAYGEDQGIYGYHSGPDLRKIASPEYDKRKPRVLLGMELEVENVDGEGDECEDNETIARSIYKSVGKVVKGYMKCERDGSLDNGFEIITAPTGLDIHAKAIKAMLSAEHIEQVHSHTTDTCGLHVHVCKAGMTVLHAAKLQQFINSVANKDLVRCVARRYQTSGSGYAKITDLDWIKHMGRVAGPYIRNARQQKKEGWGNGLFHHDSWTNGNFVEDRYSALNFRNDHTVEFRLFRGTLKYESIMACLEFAYACWFFSREASVKELTTEKFMAFICRAENRKDTKFLRAYLKAKKFRAFFQAERIARPKFDEVHTLPAQAVEHRMLDEEPMHIPVTAERAAQHRVAA